MVISSDSAHWHCGGIGIPMEIWLHRLYSLLHNQKYEFGWMHLVVLNAKCFVLSVFN